MKHAMVVYGTRPETIKLAPVVQKLKKSKHFRTTLVVTAQHREMLDQVLKLFRVEPDHDLNIMQPNQTPVQVASAAMERLDKVIRDGCFDWVLVQGDTTTAMAAALTAFYNRVKVGHVEAGLRTWDKWQPFPEEINRKVIGAISDIHFAPTGRARENLLAENVPDENIFVTGNTVIDALLWVANSKPSENTEALLESLDIDENQRLILVTAHRRENHGEPLRNICSALKEIALCRPNEVRIVYPVHLNPNVQEPVREVLSDVGNIHLTDPLDYEPFVYLMSKSHIILTDSGGIQEEAPSLGKPVLVMRDVTERPEAVEAGTAKLVGTDVKKIVRETQRLLTDQEYYLEMSRAHNPYGDGKASDRIVEILDNFEIRR